MNTFIHQDPSPFSDSGNLNKYMCITTTNHSRILILTLTPKHATTTARTQ